MAGKGWTKQVAAAAGVAAGTGAAQLGLGYGLGVVVWPVAPTIDDSAWLGSLGWATWITASATVLGAVIASRLPGGPPGRPAGPYRFALAAAAAVGALLTVALIALPARSAVRQDTFAPEMIAGGYAVIGILFGLFVAYWAVVSRPVAANLIATACYLWALAAAGILIELTMHRDSATYLTSWQFAELGLTARYGTIYWPSALLTLLAAMILGMVAAWPAVRQGDLGIGAASSGAVGPLLVAGAFFVLAPQLTGALGQLESAYLIAPYAVLTGLAGSALAVSAGRRAAQRRQALRHRPAPPTATGKAAVPAGSALDGDTDEVQTVPAAANRPGTAERGSAQPGTAERGSAQPGTAQAGPPQPGVSQTGAQQPGLSQAGVPQPRGLLRRKTTPKSAPKSAPKTAAQKTAGPKAAPKTAGPKAAPPAKSGPEKSTVAAPPTSPPIAKINPPREATPDGAG